MAFSDALIPQAKSGCSKVGQYASADYLNLRSVNLWLLSVTLSMSALPPKLLLDNYYCSHDLTAQIVVFVDQYNQRRYH